MLSMSCISRSSRASCTREACWHPARPFFVGQAPKRLQSWLTDNESLTKKLICHCAGQFRVRVQREYWQRPLPSEAAQLGLARGSITFIREVHLTCDEQRWVFARTIIPLKTLRGALPQLTQLGTQPLGAVLFANRSVTRGALQVAQIKSLHYMYNEATLGSTQTSALWGRRSLFFLHGAPLLVNELFLDTL